MGRGLGPKTEQEPSHRQKGYVYQTTYCFIAMSVRGMSYGLDGTKRQKQGKEPAEEVGVLDHVGHEVLTLEKKRKQFHFNLKFLATGKTWMCQS